MPSSKSAVAALLDILLSPSAVFRAAREHRKWFWLPLIVQIVATCGFWVWYYLSVDFDWLVDSIVAQSGKQLSAEQMQQMSAYMSPVTMLGGALFGAIVGLLAAYALYALYLLIVSKVTGDDENGYGLWFGTTAWAAFPSTLAVIGTAISYALIDSKQVGPKDLSISNLNVLVGLPKSNPWAAWLGALDLTTLWMIALMGLGISLYSGRGYGKSLAIAAAPAIVIFGIWALTIAL